MMCVPSQQGLFAMRRNGWEWRLAERG